MSSRKCWYIAMSMLFWYLKWRYGFIKAFISILKVLNNFHGMWCCRTALPRLVLVRHDMKKMTFGFDNSLSQACKKIWCNECKKFLIHFWWNESSLQQFFPISFTSLSLFKENLYTDIILKTTKRGHPQLICYSGFVWLMSWAGKFQWNCLKIVQCLIALEEVKIR